MQKFKHGVSGRANNAANYADNSSNDAYTEGKNSRVVIFTSAEAALA